MLPPSKRPPRSAEPSEVIRTGDYEVVHGSPSSRKVQAQRTSDRARAMQPQGAGDDEDKTLLFAGSIRTMLPPKPASPVSTAVPKSGKAPNMNLRGLTRQTAQTSQTSQGAPAPQAAPASERPPSPESLRGAGRRRMDTEDRTILRPTSTLPPSLQRTAPAAAFAATVPGAPPPPAPQPPSARPPAMMPTPYMPMKPLGAAGQTAPPVSLNAPGGSDRKSEPPGDPPSSVITAKTRIIRAKSSMSWAAGLMALGAIVGLVTAVVARGDADSFLDATASFVDPAHAGAPQANAAVAQAAVLPSFVETGKKTAPLGTDQNPAPGACTDTPPAPPLTVSTPVVINTPAPTAKTASIAGAEPAAAARPAPPRPAPMAFAAPHAAPRAAAPAPAAAQPPSTSGGWLANVTPPNSGAPIARPSKAAKGGGEFESAAAADALAKAQLEASLR